MTPATLLSDRDAKMKWTKGDFTTRASHGPIDRHGYIHVPFAIERNYGVWTIYHMPTGMSFLYSEWPTFREARRFAEALIVRGRWNDPKLSEHHQKFNSICHEEAQGLGYSRREVYALG